jgi:hypothetical protein
VIQRSVLLLSVIVVIAVIAVAFVVLAASMLLLVMIAATITFAPKRPDDAAGQPGYCEGKKCCCEWAY